jgi:dienelactone hydrolase
MLAMFQTAALERKHPMDRLRLRQFARGLFVALAIAGGFVAGFPTSSDAQVELGAPARQAARPRQTTGFLNRVFRDATGEHKYVVYLPSSYSPDVRWPVILYLHGAGERGNDGTLQTTVGLGPFVKARRDDFPYVVVFPQCEDTQISILQAWAPTSPDGKRALAILSQVERDYAIDAHRRILTGWSMGGYGTWSQGAADPSHWSALVPVSGGGDPTWGSKLASVPIWAFAGANDQVVPPRDTVQMVDAVRAAGGHPTLSVVPDVGHDVWQKVYNDSQLYVWLMNPKLTPAEAAAAGTGQAPASTPAFSAQPGARSPAPAELEGPFVPALSIPNAMSVRLGNDALRAIAYSAPKMIPPDALTGSINDIYSSTESSGYTFSVQFSRISYAGQLERAYIKAFAPEHLNLQLALRATMTIGATYVSGAGRSAYAGPISVVIGTRTPVWLGIDVTPYIDGERLRLKYNAARFDIPYDDWYVTPPYGVSTRGLGMTEDKVSSGLVQGIYGQKSRIEQEVQSIVPFILSKVEERLDLAEVSQVANTFWPLPVYRPRLQVWPQAVSTDERGISVLLGVTAAAIDPHKAPAKPRVERSAGVDLASVAPGTDLAVGVAPDLLQPLTKMLIDDNVARINVLDIPEKSFAAFADRKALSEVFPDLASRPSDTQVWAELRLESPIAIRDAGPTPSEARTAVAQSKSHASDEKPANQEKSADKQKPAKKENGVRVTVLKANSPETPGPRAFEFVVPKAVISIAIKDSPSATKWTPYAELDVNLVQRATATLLHRGFSERGLRLDWAGNPEVKTSAHFAPDAAPKNPEIQTEKLREMFVSAWNAWTHKGPATQFAVADIDFQYAKLRLDGVDWKPPVLSVLFDQPGIKITNSSNADLVYEVKDIYSPWSSEITLAPGKSQEFKVSEPLLFRRMANGDSSQNYTLPVGLQYEFRVAPTGGQPNLFRMREPGAVH